MKNSSNKEPKNKKGFVDFLEFAADGLERRARELSKNKHISEEYRNRYSNMADGLDTFKNIIRDYNSPYAEESEISLEYGCNTDSTYYENEFEEDSNNNYTYIPKVFLNDEKEEQQRRSSSSDDDFGEFSINDWKEKWICCGKLSTANIDNTDVGLIRLTIDDKIVYLTRAIELGAGGIKSKITQLTDFSKSKKSIFCELIQKHINHLNVDVLIVGNDRSDINICRNLEKKFIKIYHPIWM